MGLRDFGEWWRSWLIPDEETRQARAALDKEIERLVLEVAPAIRNVRGYRKRLRDPVRQAEKYTTELVETIPGPLPLSVEPGGPASLVKLLFASPGQLGRLFSASGDLASFFHRETANQVVALLTATCTEKTIFASVRQGEIIRRDVPQTAVDFTDHRIVAPAATEAECRRALREGALRLLGLRALEHLTNLKSQKEDLAEEKHLMGIKLKILQDHNRSLEGMLETDRDSVAKAVRVRKMLADVDLELQTVTAALGSPEDALNHLLSFLNNPEFVLTIRPLSLRLNWMGVKAAEDSEDPGAEISLAEMELKNRLKRVALLVSVDRKEIMDGDFL
jgi:hypothetical protein